MTASSSTPRSISPRTKSIVSISDSRRVYEISAVVLTALAKIVFMDLLNWKLFFIVLITACWITYVVIRSKKVPHLTKYWGFRTDNFIKVTRMILPFVVSSVILFFIVGYRLGTINVSWHIVPVLILYPVWGVIQQFLVIALVAGNLQDLEKKPLRRGLIVTVTALLFGLVHYPWHWLMVGTFALAILYGTVYLRERNIFAMGLFHGWLGAFFFYTVVDRDPLLEVFGNQIP